MGTRAQFFIGDPQDVSGREWLGCVAWDGYPSGDVGDLLKDVVSEGQFREAIDMLAEKRDDFCDPSKHSFPFPWRDDLFLTDVTYAWFGRSVQVTWFHRGFIPLAAYLAGSDEEREAYHEGPESLPGNVAAPISEGPKGPDSIMIIRAVS